MKNSRRDFLKTAAAATAASALPGSLMLGSRAAMAADPIKVGILHSLTGTIAIAEAHVVDAEKLAIDEINAAGGVMGRPIAPIVEDGASDWPTFAEKAQKLVESDKARTRRSPRRGGPFLARTISRWAPPSSRR
jgi:urea transport system substrate-binding protein